MTKISRNAPCPCGSGKKYKKCCASREEPIPPREAVSLGELQVEVEELDSLSNSVIDLINSGDLDRAQKVCYELLERYPDQVDGFDRLAMVYEAKGNKKKALEYYYKVVGFMKSHPGFDADSISWPQEKINRLEAGQKNRSN